MAEEGKLATSQLQNIMRNAQELKKLNKGGVVGFQAGGMPEAPGSAPTPVQDPGEFGNYEWFDESGTLIGTTDSTWLSTASFDFGTTTITLESSNNCGVIESFFDLLIQTCEIPNVITPNDDGDNDYFITNYAQLYSDVHLIVFNRWGRKVYETTSYQNDWNGLNNSGKPLADGTYFYVLTYNSNSENITGNINILGRLK